MRTIIYIDGLNLYYGCLKNTPYKWLDLTVLFSHYFSPDKYEIKSIKYFTAEVKYNHFDISVQERQNAYLRALDATGIDICPGHFSQNTSTLRMAKFPYLKIKVTKPEEKGSDVNLATAILNGAWCDEYDCAVLVSNDSDMAGAMKLIKENHPAKKIYLMTPSYWRRKPSEKLLEWSDFHEKIKSSKILEACQLPNPVEGKNGEMIYKPSAWEPSPPVSWYMRRILPIVNHIKGMRRLRREKRLNKRANSRIRKKKN